MVPAAMILINVIDRGSIDPTLRSSASSSNRLCADWRVPVPGDEPLALPMAGEALDDNAVVPAPSIVIGFPAEVMPVTS